MKFVLKVCLSLLLVISFFVSAHASVKIDGVNDGVEWQNASYKLMINEAKSNNVDYAYMISQVDSNNFDVYFLFHLSDFKSASYEKAGFILTLLNDVTVNVISDGVIIEGNADDYSVEYQISEDATDGLICEMRIGVKKGLPDNINGTISYIDGEGIKSYYFPFNIDNPNVEEEMTTEKITVSETNRVKTTIKKETTTKKSAVKKDKTTDSASTSQKKEKTTKSKENKTVVYFYEKEIIISQVYSDEASDVSENVETTALEETITSPSVTSYLENLPPSEGLKIQKVICAVGAVILIGIGAWAGISGKKRENNISQDS